MGVSCRLLASSAPLACNTSTDHRILYRKVETRARWVLPPRQGESILFDAVETVLRLSHQSRVGDGVPNIRRVLVVQDGSLLHTWHLDTLQVALVTARECHLVAIHDDVLVALEEVLLEASRVDHWWAKVDILGVQAAIDRISMSGSNLELDTFEVALGATVKRHVRVQKPVPGHLRCVLALPV